MAYQYQQNINGLVYGYSDIEIKVNGEVFDQVESINYNANRTAESFVGTSPVSSGQTNGFVEFTAELTMSLEDADRFMALLANNSPNGKISTTSFVITVAFANQGQPLIVDTLYGCRVNNINAPNAKGGAIKRTLPLFVQLIEFNGKQLI